MPKRSGRKAKDVRRLKADDRRKQRVDQEPDYVTALKEREAKHPGRT